LENLKVKFPKVCICYGTSNGSTAKTAKLIKDEFCRRTSNLDIDTFDLYENGPPNWKNYEFIVMGSPTYYNGQLQDDWSETVLTTTPSELSNKQVALFGLGDQETFCCTFVDSLGHLANWLLKECHANLIGYWPVQNCRKDFSLANKNSFDSKFKTKKNLTNYCFEESAALTTYRNNQVFYGLALDQYSQKELTAARISCWCQGLINDWKLNKFC
tara:strand:- start:48 stop:692 length:645 start_codon:yes stop_codon:yes gene_type:complete